MAEGTTDVFGLGTVPSAPDGGADELFPEADAKAPEEQETPQEQVTEETEAEGQPLEEAPQEEETPTEPEEVTEETETEQAPEETPEQPQPYLGTWQSREAAEAGVKNLQARMTQAAQEAASHRRARQEMEQMLQQAAPLIQQAMEHQRGQPTQVPSQLPPWDPDNPEVVQQHVNAQIAQALAQAEQQVDQKVEQRLQEHLTPLQQQQETERLNRGFQEIKEFREAHPDASEVESQIADIISEFRYDPETEEEIFAPTRDNLEIAYTLATQPQIKEVLDDLSWHPDPEYVELAKELVANPSLKKIVYAVPDVADRTEGIEWARQQAGLPQVVSQAQQRATQQSAANTEAERRAAYVEKGEETSQGLAPGRKPRDPLEEALFEQQNKADNIFGL